MIDPVWVSHICDAVGTGAGHCNWEPHKGLCELKSASPKKDFGYVHYSCRCVSFSRFLEDLMYVPQSDAYVIRCREKRICGITKYKKILHFEHLN